MIALDPTKATPSQISKAQLLKFFVDLHSVVTKGVTNLDQTVHHYAITGSYDNGLKKTDGRRLLWTAFQV